MRTTPVADYFRDPKHHTKEFAARDAKGNPVDEDSESAVCRCIVGQVMFLHPHNYEPRDKIYQAMVKVVRGRFSNRTKKACDTFVGEIIEFNDHPDTTPADVLSVCEEASV